MSLFDKFLLSLQVGTAIGLFIVGKFDAAVAMTSSAGWCAAYHFKSKN